jgi:hypothetical protein
MGRISALTSESTPVDGDSIPFHDASVPATRRVTLANLFTYFIKGKLEATDFSTTKIRAYAGSNQAVTSAGGKVKVSFDTESFDSLGEYDHATNYRFTCTVEGYYRVSVHVTYDTPTDQQKVSAYVYKNGVEICGDDAHASGTADISSTAIDLVYLEVDDYIEGYTSTTVDDNIQGTSSHSHITIQRVL